MRRPRSCNRPPRYSNRGRSNGTSFSRRLAFTAGLALFAWAERLGAQTLDTLAAELMRATDSPETSGLADRAEGAAGTGADTRSSGTERPGKETSPEHWTFEENELWYWFQRETMVEGTWRLSGRTRPVHKHTGRLGPDEEGYLDDEAVPRSIREPLDSRIAAGIHPAAAESADDDSGPRREVDRSRLPPGADSDIPGDGLSFDDSPPLSDPGEPHEQRRARHGRPPSRWLRSLDAAELRTWLATVEVPEAGVSGMTFWVHLTRDHLFEPRRIRGLTTEEQAKLHAAAHHGY